jgi:hypothetical protein
MVKDAPDVLICDADRLGQWRLKSATPRVGGDGWDSMAVELVGVFPGLNAAQVAISKVPDEMDMGPGTSRSSTGWPGYQPLAEAQMWCQEAEIECLGQGLFLAKLSCLGLLAPKGAARRVDAGSETQYASNIAIPGGWRENIMSMERTLQIEISYLTTTEPDTSVVGTNQTPPDAPPTPLSVWTSLPAEKALYHFPHGWVLAARPYETLAGVTGVWLVRDIYHYIQEISPTS